MDREKAIKLLRRDIECLSHDKCSDCILEKACDPMKTPPDSEYIEAYGMAIEALSAEPCEDAISRQAAIDAAIDGADDWDGGYNPTREEYIKKAINALPSVTPQKMGRWIPVSEGLPEEREWYLAVFKEKDTNFHLIPRVADYIGHGENKWQWVDGEGLPQEYMDLLECIAWMPLPEPYKAESED